MARNLQLPTSGRGDRRLVTAPTLADQAYKTLRDDISMGRLEPATRLTERSLAEWLGVSPTPIREALQRLEHERLIVRTGTRSIRVAAPTLAHLRELSLIEAALRGVAARLAAENATAQERAAIKAKFAELEVLPKRFTRDRQVRDRGLRMTRELHQLIDGASHSDTLCDMIATATAFDAGFRSRFASELYASGTTITRSHQQHRDIVAAVLDGDPERAEQTMRQHILGARQHFRDVVEATAGDLTKGPGEPAG
jgi:DNA-binding GntR family transcriptional regulator